MKFSVIGPFKAYNVRLDASNSVSGLPPMTGILGCVDLIRRHFSGEEDQHLSKTDLDVMVVLHDVEVKPGQLRPSPSSNGSPIELPEAIEGTVEATLIIQGLDVAGNRAAQFLLSKRFCGGTVVLAPSATRDRDGEDLSRILNSLPSGRVLLDRRDLLDRDVPGDPLDKILHYLSWTRGNQNDQENGGGTGQGSERMAARRPEPGWLVPLAVGYQALEAYDATRVRQGTRDEQVPHLFVEDLIGLGELVSSRVIAKRLRNDPCQDTCFWKWRVDLERGEFLITAHS